MPKNANAPAGKQGQVSHTNKSSLVANTNGVKRTCALFKPGESKLEAALWYAQHGWKIFPLRPGEKHPLGGQGFKDATTDEQTIRAWWEQTPNANLGLAMEYNGLVAIDVDPRNGGDKTIAELETALGALPRVFHQRTQSGGEHIIFKRPPSDVELRGKLNGGIDIKDKGYLVVSPSTVSGNPYTWVRFPDDLANVPELPTAWLEPLRKPAKGTKANIGKQGRGATARREGLAEDWTQDVPARALTKAESADLSRELAALPQRARGENVTFRAFKLIFHNFGRGHDSGWPYLETWNEVCGKPHDEAELERQFTRIAEAPDDAPRGFRLFPGLTFTRDDKGNADRLAHRIGGRFVFCEEAWWRYTGGVWAKDATNAIIEEAKAIATDVRAEVDAYRKAIGPEPSEPATKALRAMEAHARGLGAERAITAMVRLARSIPAIAGVATEFDGPAVKDLFNCVNGTIDLTTGELRPHAPEDRLTLQSPVEFVPAARCERFDRFYAEILPEAGTRAWLWRFFGACLTGRIEGAMVMPVCFGYGANGKSTLLNVVSEILGPYATPVSSSLLSRGRGVDEDGERTQKAMAVLAGKRLGITNELADGALLNEEALKQALSRESIVARRLYENTHTFAPSHKLILTTNHKPKVRGVDHGTHRRLALVCFGERFEGAAKDERLAENLRAEYPGVLARLVTEARAFLKEGLPELPPAIEEATREYRQDEDWLAGFTGQLDLSAEGRVLTNVHTEFAIWAVSAGEGRRLPMAARVLANELRNRGFEVKKQGKHHITTVFPPKR